MAHDSAFGEIESTKTVADLHAPVTGTVVDVNTDHEEQPNLVNTDPYGAAWIVLLETSQPLDDGLSAAEYRRDIESR